MAPPDASGDQFARQRRRLRFLGKQQGLAVRMRGEAWASPARRTRGLPLARYRVTLEAVEPLDVPAYLGSTLRGAFGRAFRRLCCFASDGEPSLASQSCPYHLIFETAPPPAAGALRTHEETPRPFVIAPPPESAPAYPVGSEVAFDLTLVGQARDMLPHFVVTLRPGRLSDQGVLSCSESTDTTGVKRSGSRTRSSGATRPAPTFNDRVEIYVDSPLMTHRVRLKRQLFARIEGIYGIYRTWVRSGSRGLDCGCTCPSEWRPCKHVAALQRTWRLNPRSFFDGDGYWRPWPVGRRPS